MSQTVFILGAGASVNAGAPLMKDFLDIAEGLLVRNEVEDSVAEFKLVFKAISALTQAHSKATLDLINIESTFAAFEMGKLLGRLGTFSAEEIDRLPESMRKVIVRTLEKSVKIPVVNERAQAPHQSPNLTDLMIQVFQKRRNGWEDLAKMFSIITFNYDLCLDLTFHFADVPVKYHLDDVQAQEAISISVLKLHGSLNWGRCSACEKLVAWPLAKYFQNRLWLPGTTSRLLEISQRTRDFQHCNSGAFTGPYVVPPTWNKGQYHNSLESVWKAAASELASAENIFVSGYSLPESDHFFRYLYALGTIGELRVKRFWVFDPDSKVEQRFRSLLGQAVLPNFHFFAGNFYEMFGEIVKLF